MNRRRPLSPDAHAHLDGAGRAPESPEERRVVEQLSRALSHYSQSLEVPGPEVDQRVMAVLRSTPVASRNLWRMLLSPMDVRVRPATMLAGAVVLLVMLALFLPRGVQTRTEEPDALPQSVLVQFDLQAPAAQSVSLAGSFNGWSPVSIPLRRSADSGRWTVTIPLSPGEHEYLFVVDGGEWVADPHAHAQVDDGLGQSNSVITVGPRGVARS